MKFDKPAASSLMQSKHHDSKAKFQVYMKHLLKNIIISVALLVSIRIQGQDIQAIIRERVDANETPGIVVAVYENWKTSMAPASGA